MLFLSIPMFESSIHNKGWLGEILHTRALQPIVMWQTLVGHSYLVLKTKTSIFLVSYSVVSGNSFWEHLFDVYEKWVVFQKKKPERHISKRVQQTGFLENGGKRKEKKTNTKQATILAYYGLIASCECECESVSFLLILYCWYVVCSIWTVDLAHLLQKFSVRFSYFTVTLGANPNFSAETFYKVMPCQINCCPFLLYRVSSFFV